MIDKHARKVIIDEMLKNNGVVTRGYLLKKLWAYYTDVNEIDELMKDFQNANMIEIESFQVHGTIYTMKTAVMNEYYKLFKRK